MLMLQGIGDTTATMRATIKEEGLLWIVQDVDDYRFANPLRFIQRSPDELMLNVH